MQQLQEQRKQLEDELSIGIAQTTRKAICARKMYHRATPVGRETRSHYAIKQKTEWMTIKTRKQMKSRNEKRHNNPKMKTIETKK